MKVRKQDVWAVVERAFPEYRGRKFALRARGSVVLSDLHWSGGTRNQYCAVALDDSGRANALQLPAPWFHNAEGAECVIPEGWAVVEHTHYCGKDMGITVHVRPDAVAKLLPNASVLAHGSGTDFCPGESCPWHGGR